MAWTVESAARRLSTVEALPRSSYSPVGDAIRRFIDEKRSDSASFTYPTYERVIVPSGKKIQLTNPSLNLTEVFEIRRQGADGGPLSILVREMKPGDETQWVVPKDNRLWEFYAKSSKGETPPKIAITNGVVTYLPVELPPPKSPPPAPPEATVAPAPEVTDMAPPQGLSPMQALGVLVAVIGAAGFGWYALSRVK